MILLTVLNGEKWPQGASKVMSEAVTQKATSSREKRTSCWINCVQKLLTVCGAILDLQIRVQGTASNIGGSKVSKSGQKWTVRSTGPSQPLDKYGSHHFHFTDKWTKAGRIKWFIPEDTTTKIETLNLALMTISVLCILIHKWKGPQGVLVSEEEVVSF